MIEVRNLKIQMCTPDGTVALGPSYKDTNNFSSLKVYLSGDGEYAGALSVQEFADEAGISPQAVRKMIAGNRVVSDKVGKQHVIPRRELDRYLSR